MAGGTSTGNGSPDGSGNQPDWSSQPKVVVTQQTSASDGTNPQQYGPYVPGHAPASGTINKHTQDLTQDFEARNPPPPSGQNYASQDSNQLYAAVHAADRSQVGTVAASWNNVANKLVTITSTLSDAAKSASSGWEGDAANAAMAFHTQVSNWTNSAAAGAQVTAANVNDQATAAGGAQSNMPQPYTYTMQQALDDVSKAPDPAAAVPHRAGESGQGRGEPQPVGSGRVHVPVEPRDGQSEDARHGSDADVQQQPRQQWVQRWVEQQHQTGSSGGGGGGAAVRLG